ncbi:hypothetical protein [Algoriphagus sp.]|uniref:hypothetical protein n=1 Tax=Algoriphagus sp. TaxID=1872435 RepID=UPI002638EA91|nr:hypothetical protein [Algoriphagus sp.]
MNQQFFHIATLGFSHEYTGDSYYDGFSFAPTAETKILAKNLNLILKPTVGGIAVFSGDPELLAEEERELNLDLFSTNPLFYNFTDFGREFRPDMHVFFFALQEGKQLLHAGDTVSVNNSLTVLRREAFQDLLTKVQQDKIQLLDREELEIPSNQVHRFLADPEARVFYGIEKGERKGFFKPSTKMEKTPFARMILSCSQLHKGFIQTQTPSLYSVRFKTKQTRWKYILSDKAYDKFNDLKIIDAQNSDIHFRETEFEIQDSWKVRSFESEAVLPFQVDGWPKFQLVEQSNGGQVFKVVIKQLPKASPEGLSRSTINDDVLVTHIFI